MTLLFTVTTAQRGIVHLNKDLTLSYCNPSITLGDAAAALPPPSAKRTYHLSYSN